MEYLRSYLIENFVLICACVVILINSIQHVHQHLRVSTYSILVVILVFILSLSNTFQDVSRDALNTNLTLLFAVIGYILRPAILLVFIFMSWDKLTPLKAGIAAIPLALVVIVYSFAFIPALGDYIVKYTISIDEGVVHFGGGPLRFTSHIIGACYLGFLLSLSIFKLKLKHLNHAFAIMFCAVFAILAVLIETFFDDKGEVIILNATIGVSAISYYLFLYMERTQFDSLTGLFNRETLYRDLPRFNKSVTGVIQFDLNGLKFINDNYGHFEGDKALATVAQLIVKSEKKNMYAYRLGGDEYIVLAVNCSEESINETLHDFKEAIAKSDYYCSTGMSFRKDSNTSITDLIKEAEQNMYKDKAEFYKNSPFERRKS